MHLTSTGPSGRCALVLTALALCLAGCTSDKPTSSPTARATPPGGSLPSLPAPSPSASSSLPATPNQARLAAGCPAGSPTATWTGSGITLTVVTTSSANVELCLLLPSGEQVHPVQDGASGYGAFIDQFPDGSYFKADSLGHVFLQIGPGNISGVTVVVPAGKRTRVLGPIAGGAVDAGANPFRITVTSNDCTPNCAKGHLTTKLIRWHPAQGDYS